MRNFIAGQIATVHVPDNPTADPWIDLFNTMLIKYSLSEENEVSNEKVERRIQEAKNEVLTEYGLHLNV